MCFIFLLTEKHFLISAFLLNISFCLLLLHYFTIKNKTCVLYVNVFVALICNRRNSLYPKAFDETYLNKNL